jgi:hypothetical protein
MTLHTVMPLELVWEGSSKEPGPYLDITVRGVQMQVQPAAPGLGRIVRLYGAPLDCYLMPQFSPGQLIAYDETSVVSPTASEHPSYKGEVLPTQGQL